MVRISTQGGGPFTFYIGRFYETGVASLAVFFGYHVWLYLFLVPAIGMRLWAEEKKVGELDPLKEYLKSKKKEALN